MNETVSRRMLLKSYPTAAPSADNFEIVEAPVPEPGRGEVLVRAIYLTVDPYMRGRLRPGPSYAEPQKIGEVMVGEVAGQVVASNAEGYAAGDYVAAHIGWQTLGIADARDIRKLDPQAAPISTALGVLGMPGLTAYFGTLEVLTPKAGDTLVVNAASGAVGSVVGQIGKIGGCRVVGIAGSDAKIDFITKELGFDAGINYRTTENMSAALAAACPDGIDCYFDNVGGPITDAVFENMAFGCRVAICGQISQYNDTEQAMGPRNLRHFLVKRATLRGLLVFDWRDRYEAGLARLTRWVQDGRLKYREDIVDGLENAPAAFAGLMEGKNFGKQLVRIGEDPTRA
jgi:NADPH-dependent curcumin reductase CurA